MMTENERASVPVVSLEYDVEIKSTGLTHSSCVQAAAQRRRGFSEISN